MRADGEVLAGAEAGPKLYLGDGDAEQGTPIQVGGDEVCDLLTSARHEDDIIGKAGGGDTKGWNGDPKVLCCCPAVEGFEQQVEKIRAGRAALRQAVGSLPGAAVQVAISKSAL